MTFKQLENDSVLLNFGLAKLAILGISYPAA